MKKFVEKNVNIYYNVPLKSGLLNPCSPKIGKNKEDKMNKNQTLRETLSTDLGNERSASVIHKISRAYKNGTRGEKLGVYLNEVIKEEGMMGRCSINLAFVRSE